MTLNMAGAVAAVVAVSVFIIGTVLSVKYTYLSRKVQFRERARAQGCATRGVCEKRRQSYSISESPSGTETYYHTVTIKYKYTVDGVDYYKKVKYRHDSFDKDDHFDDPMNINIFYDAGNPKKAYAESEVSDDAAKHSGMLLTLFLTAALGLGTFFGLIYLFQIPTK